MKWYWAILLTILIFIGQVVLFLNAGPKGELCVQFVVAIFGIWAAAKSGSLGWGLFVFFVWPLGFPCFLINRYKMPSTAASQVTGANPRTEMVQR